MIDVALVSVIRRWHFRDGQSIRAIARKTGLSRNTVRKYLHSPQLDPQYPSRKSPSKLDDFEETLNSWLHRESKRHRKQRKTVRNLYQDLVLLGFDGSYDRVAAFARQWRQTQLEREQGAGKQAYVPLRFALGEAFQFDWGDGWAVIAGQRYRLQIAHFKLSGCRAFYLRAYWAQSHEMLFDAHNHAFRVFGGVPERGIYDNMKTAVDKVGRGKERVINRRFQTMVSHYLFEAEFCNPAAGWEKGQIEKSVQDARHSVWQEAPRFATLEALNEWLEAQCLLEWQRLKHPEHPESTLADIWLEEKRQLMPKPADFDGYVEMTKRVSSTCLIHVDRNRYSVPASFANRHVSAHLYPDQIVIIAEGQEVARHQRVFLRDHNKPPITVYDWRHYLAVAQRKPGALRNGAPFQELPEAFLSLQKQLLRRPAGDRDMVDILSLVLRYDETIVLKAIEQALATGHPSKQHVVNSLNRLAQPDIPEPIKPSPALSLSQEPIADTERYDQLRRSHHAH